MNAGDTVSVHATYDTSRADWYEVMGIMPVAVYHDNDLPDSQDAQDPACPTPNTHPPPAGCIPEEGVETHGHLAENDNHGGDPTGAADPFSLPSAPSPGNTVNIQSFAYHAGNVGLTVPTIQPGQIAHLPERRRGPRRQRLPHDHRLQGPVYGQDRHRLPDRQRAGDLRLRRARQ